MRRLVLLLIVMILAGSLASVAAVHTVALVIVTPDPAQGAATGLEEGAEPTPPQSLVLTLTAEAPQPWHAYLPAAPCTDLGVTPGNPCNWIYVTLTPTPTKVTETPTALATATISATSTFVPTAPTETPTATDVVSAPETLIPTVTGTYPDLPPVHGTETPTLIPTAPVP